MKTKTFDCVEMKREGARRVYEKTRNMTPAEELAFWRRRTAALRRRQHASSRAKPARSGAPKA